jgi:hypothetical protein
MILKKTKKKTKKQGRHESAAGGEYARLAAKLADLVPHESGRVLDFVRAAQEKRYDHDADGNTPGHVPTG